MKRSTKVPSFLALLFLTFFGTYPGFAGPVRQCPAPRTGICPIAINPADLTQTRFIAWVPRTESRPAAPAEGTAPILFSIIMHNEEATPYHLNSEIFRRQRTALVTFAEMLKRNRVKFNFQPDWTFLQAVYYFDREPGPADTNGKNIIRWLLEDMAFEVNPHAHETQCNYADVARLLEVVSGTGAPPVAGGMIAGPPECSIIEQFWSPIQSTIDPTYSWQAEILWGGGTPGHVQEQDLWLSGVWRPKDKYHFAVHDPDKPAFNIGKYGASWPALDHLLDRQKKGQLISNQIHTAAVSLQTEYLLEPFYIESFEMEIKKRASENILWFGLEEIGALWKGALYNQEPNIVPYLWSRINLPWVAGR